MALLRLLVALLIALAATSLGTPAGAAKRARNTDRPSGAQGAPEGGAFPGGALAVVSLTYDDGLDSHLAIAQPALEAAGLRGTFFLSSFEGVDHDWALPNTSSPLQPRHLAWQAAAARGHELAAHTVHHPCDDPRKAPGYRLADYTLARMAAELDDSVERLERLGGAPPFTFAYPCTSDRAGVGPDGESIAPLVAARFVAARVSDAVLAIPRDVELLRVPQLDAAGKSGEELVATVDQAIAARRWLVLVFHGVGEDASCPDLNYSPRTCAINYLTTSTEAHAHLIDALAARRAEVWTATFREVARFLAEGPLGEQQGR